MFGARVSPANEDLAVLSIGAVCRHRLADAPRQRVGAGDADRSGGARGQGVGPTRCLALAAHRRQFASGAAQDPAVGDEPVRGGALAAGPADGANERHERDDAADREEHAGNDEEGVGAEGARVDVFERVAPGVANVRRVVGHQR